MSDLWRIVLSAVIGVGTGVLSGMFGIGGAVVSTPAIRVLGASPLAAVGSTIPSIIPSAVSGAIRYRREGPAHARRGGGGVCGRGGCPRGAARRGPVCVRRGCTSARL